MTKGKSEQLSGTAHFAVGGQSRQDEESGGEGGEATGHAHTE